jgi:hypothetical protein
MAGKSTCAVTNDQVKEAIKKYPTRKQAADAIGTNLTTLLRWEKYGVPKNIKGDAPKKADAAKKTEAMPKGAINISGLRKSPRKPNTGCKPFFHNIPAGIGYPIEFAAEEWGFSLETIRRAALELGARVYVETSKDVWIEMVIKPKG